MKLTDAQKAMLERLASGDQIHVLTGINAHAFYHSDMKTARWGTLSGLSRRKLVQQEGKGVNMTMSITPAGRAALERREG